ncbi:stressosome-associated protein Prli42 [Bacillus methanolicus]|nr:stressosome-associated protein Prli42 [Bacillus methanolicus]
MSNRKTRKLIVFLMIFIMLASSLITGLKILFS